jgi:hypothetical protein
MEFHGNYSRLLQLESSLSALVDCLGTHGQLLFLPCSHNNCSGSSKQLYFEIALLKLIAISYRKQLNNIMKTLKLGFPSRY